MPPIQTHALISNQIRFRQHWLPKWQSTKDVFRRKAVDFLIKAVGVRHSRKSVEFIHVCNSTKVMIFLANESKCKI